ncbi:glycosyltransferase family 4 protein [Sphingobium sp. AS12]|uniref:glycosyltransferase family 4 protein n=1 Tax=Sphingobium sp. AS12 TaxID=2849495 RepID=UPI001C31CD7D|nr:glycosyltransferase family 4 protein [Sphingobium sp. AS12]MBV2149765.1 glycosyltransferase family 4 protein [Sphingobium sp. AS12]
MAALRLAAGLEEAGWSCRGIFLYYRKEMNNVDHTYECLLDRPPRSPGDFIKIIWRLRGVMRMERPEAVVCFLPLAMVLGSLIAQNCGVRQRIVSHRVPADTYGAMMRWLDILAAWAGLYTEVVAVSKSVGRSCKPYPRWLKRRIHVVYNGLKGWRRSDKNQEEARSHFGLTVKGKLIVAVGRLDAQKNYPVLIDAMVTVPADVRLAIAGQGELLDEIIAQIARLKLQERVTVLGAISRTDVPHLLAAADVFAQPSLFEGQSNALLEALAAGLPCIVSDAPEQIETITSNTGEAAGLVLPATDPVAWSEGIASFLSDDGRLITAKARAKERSEAFTYDKMVNGFAKVVGAD